MNQELSNPPLTSLLSHYIMRPVNLEADPYFYPKPKYQGNKQDFKKGGYKKNYTNNEEDKADHKKEEGGFQRNYKNHT